MRIPPPTTPQSQNFLQSGGLRPEGSAGGDVRRGGVLGSQALARASALDAATARAGPTASRAACCGFRECACATRRVRSCSR